jgi:hypothetical protein
VPAVAGDPPPELGPLALDRLVEVGPGEPQSRHGRLVEQGDGVLTDRTDAVLGVPGRTDLAHEDDVERRVETLRHLVGDRHPAAGQREHERIVVREAVQLLREPATGVAAILVGHTVMMARADEPVHGPRHPDRLGRSVTRRRRDGPRRPATG